jgi:hypothetical protein
MFGLKKRRYRHEVAQMIAAMAMPENIELATAKIAHLLEGGIDRFFNENRPPINAAIEINYVFLRNIHKNRENYGAAGLSDETKKLIVASSASMIVGDVSKLLSDSAISDISTMLKEIEAFRINQDQDLTYGQFLQKQVEKTTFIQEAIKKIGL